MTTDPGAPWLIVGLGNPGPGYAITRHTVGLWGVYVRGGGVGGNYTRGGKAQAQVVEGRIGPPGPGSRRVVLVKPMSYMNLSGGPVNALRDFYKVPVGNVVAVHDELDIDYGTLRLKLGGGDNGHNGLKSITKALGSDYHRARFGIGRPPGRMQVADFVLKDFSAAERKELDYFVDRAADAVECLVIEGLERAQSTYNS